MMKIIYNFFKIRRLYTLLGNIIFFKTVSSIDIPIFITDDNGLIIYVNDAYEKLTGYKFSELNGEKTSIVSSGIHPKSFYKKMWNTVKGTEDVEGVDWEGEIINKKKTGDLYHTKLKIKRITGKNNFKGFLATQTDITENKEVVKSLINEKHLRSEMLESIRYAKRIQTALQPSCGSNILFEAFTVDKPKGIVGGDFHFCKKLQNGYKILVVGDCTGHGVPGAFMTLLAIAHLKQITNHISMMDKPSAEGIMYMLNENIIESLKYEADDGYSVTDGIDLTICLINNKQIDICSAGRPVYFSKDGEITKLKRGLSSINGHGQATFKSYNYPIDGINMLYLTSDGYIDQFGHETNKKYSQQRFSNRLTEVNQLSLDEQKVILENDINEWMGDTEQTDDIMVVGVKLN